MSCYQQLAANVSAFHTTNIQILQVENDYQKRSYLKYHYHVHNTLTSIAKVPHVHIHVVHITFNSPRWLKMKIERRKQVRVKGMKVVACCCINRSLISLSSSVGEH